MRCIIRKCVFISVFHTSVRKDVLHNYKEFFDHLLHFGWLGSWTLSAVLSPAFQIEHNTDNKTGFISEMLSYVWSARQQDES